MWIFWAHWPCNFLYCPPHQLYFLSFCQLLSPVQNIFFFSVNCIFSWRPTVSLLIIQFQHHYLRSWADKNLFSFIWQRNILLADKWDVNWAFSFSTLGAKWPGTGSYLGEFPNLGSYRGFWLCKKCLELRF